MVDERWTYEGYWNTVLGANRNSADVVREFELVATGLDEWLGTAEAEAWVAGGGKDVDLPEEWREYHTRAVAALTEAATMHEAAHDVQSAITDADVKTLATEAAAAGDVAMVAICRIALGETSEDVGEDLRLGTEEDAIVSQYESRADARAECERVITEARRRSEEVQS